MTRLFVRRETPETRIQNDIIKYLVERVWAVKPTYGTIYSFGWPDLYTAHTDYGARWIEVKTPTGRLRETQVEFITDFALVGIGVWVLCAATPVEYRKLFHPPNWQEYI
jgi:hypothetical protein